MHKLIHNAARLAALAALAVTSACSFSTNDPGAPPAGPGVPIFLPGPIPILFGMSVTVTPGTYDDSNPAALTGAVIADFDAAILFCDAIDGDEYTVDCLSERLSLIAAKLPQTGDFAQMRSVIADASARLGTIAAQSPSPVLPSRVISSTGAAPVTTIRPLRATATESLSANLAAADAVIEQAQLTLLRSTTNSEDRSLNYQQVAAVVGRTRTLLRSA